MLSDKRYIDTHVKLSRNPELLSSDMDGEIVMMSIDNGEYYGLDMIGSRIWELLESPCSFQSIISTLMEEYEVPALQCENDVSDFLDSLLEKKIIVLLDE
jgi:hypothetical protein